MQNLSAVLHKYMEPTEHETEDLILHHPFNIKYFNNDEHYPDHGVSVSSARSQEYL